MPASSSPNSPSHGALRQRGELDQRREAEPALQDAAAVVGHRRADLALDRRGQGERAAHAEADDAGHLGREARALDEGEGGVDVGEDPLGASAPRRAARTWQKSS